LDGVSVNLRRATSKVHEDPEVTNPLLHAAVRSHRGYA
jgi:hypothetical protein